MEIEHVDFVSLRTGDLSRSKHFYSKILGLEIETDADNGTEFRAGQVTLALVDPSVRAGIALRVSDVRAARAELEEQGVEFEGQTVDTGICHLAYLRDPDGNLLILHRRYAAPDNSPT
jgi:catechol 2,3-dioxygenase-like lactoylglutathione lyase family enzyme